MSLLVNACSAASLKAPILTKSIGLIAGSHFMIYLEASWNCRALTHSCTNGWIRLLVVVRPVLGNIFALIPHIQWVTFWTLQACRGSPNREFQPSLEVWSTRICQIVNKVIMLRWRKSHANQPFFWYFEICLDLGSFAALTKYYAFVNCLTDWQANKSFFQILFELCLQLK